MSVLMSVLNYAVNDLSFYNSVSVISLVITILDIGGRGFYVPLSRRPMLRRGFSNYITLLTGD